MDFTDNLRSLVLSQLALANRDPAKIGVVVDTLVEMLGAALVVNYRDDGRAMDQACALLEGAINRSALEQQARLKAFGAFDGDDLT
ncbi:hypothetical protein [Caulobacter segnis]|uniref:hypothetical protein n=1 Tax=Caulobacter segnis TaxID=88688 RepID=UPI00286009BA|nr:hypothetical protein [Caulobacter segnis]MDR6624441.1 hypothetical protein [Caulobacter segnis]